jgi:hypothetical protein
LSAHSLGGKKLCAEVKKYKSGFAGFALEARTGVSDVRSHKATRNRDIYRSFKVAASKALYSNSGCSTVKSIGPPENFSVSVVTFIGFIATISGSELTIFCSPVTSASFFSLKLKGLKIALLIN